MAVGRFHGSRAWSSYEISAKVWRLGDNPQRGPRLSAGKRGLDQFVHPRLVTTGFHGMPFSWLSCGPARLRSREGCGFRKMGRRVAGPCTLLPSRISGTLIYGYSEEHIAESPQRRVKTANSTCCFLFRNPLRLMSTAQALPSDPRGRISIPIPHFRDSQQLTGRIYVLCSAHDNPLVYHGCLAGLAQTQTDLSCPNSRPATSPAIHIKGKCSCALVAAFGNPAWPHLGHQF